ncbi:MAG: hypothetical protein ACOVOV_09080 [Dolichospermum sp.]
MKKSIYKVTGWSLAISAAIMFGISRNNTNSVSVSSGGGYVSNSDEGSVNQENGIAINYNNTIVENTNSDQGAAINPINKASNTNKNQDIVAVKDLDLLDTKRTDELGNDFSEQKNEQEAIAKGGPSNNVNTEYLSTEQSVSVSSNISTVSQTSSTNTINSNVASARASAPTIVTAPTPPGGSSSGGSGGGDPFVPIDDYYGLIFLIAMSTVVGIFTIRKAKI